jgi:hypothetical protein
LRDDGDEAITKKNPELKSGDVLKALSRAWKALPEKVGEKYDEASKEARAKFKKAHPDPLPRKHHHKQGGKSSSSSSDDPPPKKSSKESARFRAAKPLERGRRVDASTAACLKLKAGGAGKRGEKSSSSKPPINQ